jgi:hypothetical protein
MTKKLKNKKKLTSARHLHILPQIIVGISLSGIFVLSSVDTAMHKQPLQTVTVAKSASQHSAYAPKVKTSTVTPTPAAVPLTKTVKPPAASVPSHASLATPKPAAAVTPAPGSSVSNLTPSVPPTSSSSSDGSSSPSQPSSSPSPPAATPSYTSTNWSGYLATGASFSGISGSWIAPSPTGISGETSADASWIGIGGVTTDDLIQVGTQDTIRLAGQVSTAAFYELLPGVSEIVPDITVTPGDAMSASLAKLTANEWNISITDTTNHQSYATTVSYASSQSSAEWIEEDPSFSNLRLIPFDNFGTVSFTNSSATASGSTLSIAGSQASPITLLNRAGQTEATPSAINADGASFSITRDGTP